MGGTTFETFQPGKLVDAAFQDAQKHARYTYGHGGYTGTIAEKDGYRIINLDTWNLHVNNEAGMPYQKALSFARQLVDQRDSRIDDKWGPAGALRVKQRASKNQPRMDGWLFFGWASE